jgi:elongation factor 2
LAADTTARFKLNKESNEYILSGIDPLQIEILTKRINLQVPITVGEPIIVYREKATQEGTSFHTKSTNGHNRIEIRVEQLDPVVEKLIIDGEIVEDMNPKEAARILTEKAGWGAREGRKIIDVYEGNMFIDESSAVQRLDRIKSYMISAWREFLNSGPLAGEPISGIKAVFTDATVHTDPAHTGYGEIATMVTAALALSFMSTKPRLFEPIQKVDIKTPNGTEGEIIKVLTQHRGQIGSIDAEGSMMSVRGQLPASETVEIADDFRGATQGRALFGYEFMGFHEVPASHHDRFVDEIRRRKGIGEARGASSFERFIYKRTG